MTLPWLLASLVFITVLPSSEIIFSGSFTSCKHISFFKYMLYLNENASKKEYIIIIFTLYSSTLKGVWGGGDSHSYGACMLGAGSSGGGNYCQLRLVFTLVEL